MSILNVDYERLNSNSIFNEKLQEFCCLIKPDGEFFEQIKKKELAIFDLDANMDNYNLLDQSDQSDGSADGIESKTRDTKDAASMPFKITVTEPNGHTTDLKSGEPVQKDDTNEFGEIFKMNNDDVQRSYEPPYPQDFGDGHEAIPLGFGGYGPEEDDNSIFEILAMPDCSPFFMTGLTNCKTF